MSSQRDQHIYFLASEVGRFGTALASHSVLKPSQLRLVGDIPLSHFHLMILILIRSEGLGTLVVFVVDFTTKNLKSNRKMKDEIKIYC